MPRLAIALALLLLCGARVAAQEDPNLEVARGHFRTGVAYFDRGEYAKALSEFKAARALSGRPELDFNIAKAYERLGDAARALSYYERYFQARPDAGPDAEAREQLEALRRRVGKLRITTAPEAHLTVDGE